MWTIAWKERAMESSKRLSTTDGYIASHRETHDNFDSRLLASDPLVLAKECEAYDRNVTHRWVLDSRQGWESVALNFAKLLRPLMM